MYINKHNLLKNVALVLVANGKKFDTWKEMVDFALEKFTPDQIDETLMDMPFCEDKDRFWYAARCAFSVKLENAYKEAHKSVCPYESYKEVLPGIDHSFNETVGIFDFFCKAVEEYAKALKSIEESGLNWRRF